MTGSTVLRAPRALLVGLVVLVLVVAGGLVWWSQRPYATDLDGLGRGGEGAAGAAPGLAARSLAALGEAVADADPAAARALAPAGDAAAGDRLAALVDNAGDLGVDGFALRYLDELDAASTGPGGAGGEGADAGWPAAVEVTWRFAGFDPAPARVETPVGFVREGDRVAITGFGGPPAEDSPGLPGIAEAPRDTVRTPTWLAGPVAVRRTATTLVVVAAGASAAGLDADAYGDLARRAVAPVAAELPGWDRRLVVEVPADTDGLAAALGAPAPDVAEVAALTASADGSLGEGAGVHVYVNPEVYDGLGRRGAQLVMTHEAVHVATRAPGSPAPVWLIEGFADVVAVRDSGVGEAVAAAQIADDVRRDGPPDALPDAADFDVTGPHVGAAYESAWIACLVLAEAAGDAGLRRIYERVDDGDDVAAVVSAEAGIDLAELTRRWQDRLVDLAARGAVRPEAQ